MPADLAHLVTVLITTSPTPSNPSTDLIGAVVDSFRKYCPELLRCPHVVVFDNFTVDENIKGKNRMKKGKVREEMGLHYAEYKDNVKSLLCDEGMRREEGEKESWPYDAWSRTTRIALMRTYREGVVAPALTFLEMGTQLGFGLAVREGLREVKTPYVIVVQHDWVFCADIPIRAILNTMVRSEEEGKRFRVRYVGMNGGRSLQYAIRRAQVHPVLWQTTRAMVEKREREEGDVELTPLFHWFDKPHICSVQHYLSTVFTRSGHIARGDFIEDKFGHRMMDECKEKGEEAMKKYCAWMWYPDHGRTAVLWHLRGRKRGGDEERVKELRDNAVPKVKNNCDALEEHALSFGDESTMADEQVISCSA
ncbi:hypothetical protein YB2330_006398 [Saitoella coloradoensis]